MITLNVTLEQLNGIMNALNAAVLYQQQQTAVLLSTLQAQAMAQTPAANQAQTPAGQ